MGILRVYLACAVMFGHVDARSTAYLMPGPTAVWLFFMISGFYMQMILSGRYGDNTLLFYTNRAARIYPTYFLALLFGAAIPSLWPAETASLAQDIVYSIPNFLLLGPT